MWAHHDGSDLYLTPGHHTLGGEATVRIRVAHGAPITVWVRTVEDGEPRFTAADPLGTCHGEQWFEATIQVRNPVTNYRFLLTTSEAGSPPLYAWVNGTGIHLRDVSDAHDFRLTAHEPAPRWAREGVLYQIFPDRFATTGAATSGGRSLPEWAIPRQWEDPVAPAWPETSHEYFGGDLPGITAHLDYLHELGVTGVYLTPIFPGASNHRYDASTFTEVDPLLGGNAALAELSAALHARGMQIVGDLTTNHTGNSHEWFRRAQRDPESPEHSFYYWTEAGYECWLGVQTLPKLNYHSRDLWDRFIHGPDSVVGKWLQPPYHLDGWRIDVANMTGRRLGDDFAHEVARTVRATATDLNPEALVVGEHFHDATSDVQGDGWHANMNYTGFTRPLWAWLAHDGGDRQFLGVPAAIPRLPGREVVATMNDFLAQIPWQVRQAQWNMLGSHDTARIRTVVGSNERLIVAAAALLTLPGTPVIFAGDELGAEGINGEHSRTPIPWGREEQVNPLVLGAYRDLIRVRRSEPALTGGGHHWVLVDDDALGFVREDSHSRVLVVLTRAAFDGHLHVPGAPLDLARAGQLFNSGQVRAVVAGAPGNGETLAVSCEGSCPPGSAVAIQAGGPAAVIWRFA